MFHSPIRHRIYWWRHILFISFLDVVCFVWVSSYLYVSCGVSFHYFVFDLCFVLIQLHISFQMFHLLCSCVASFHFRIHVCVWVSSYLYVSFLFVCGSSLCFFSLLCVLIYVSCSFYCIFISDVCCVLLRFISDVSYSFVLLRFISDVYSILFHIHSRALLLSTEASPTICTQSQHIKSKKSRIVISQSISLQSTQEKMQRWLYDYSRAFCTVIIKVYRFHCHVIIRYRFCFISFVIKKRLMVRHIKHITWGIEELGTEMLLLKLRLQLCLSLASIPKLLILTKEMDRTSLWSI